MDVCLGLILNPALTLFEFRGADAGIGTLYLDVIIVGATRNDFDIKMLKPRFIYIIHVLKLQKG